jgi:spermidine/putrescine transport system permease protein
VTTAAEGEPRAARAARTIPGLGSVVLTLPATLGLLVFFAAPFITFAVYSFMTAGLFEVSQPFTTEPYSTVLGSDVNRTLASNSFWTALLAATATIAVSLPIAYWLRYSAGRWRIPVLFLITATFFASYLVRIYAWKTILGRRGALNTALEGVGLTNEPLEFLLYNKFAVTIALVHIFLPYTVLVIYAAFGPVSTGLLEAAQDLGAGALRRWTRVVLPLVAAPASAAFVFVFVLSAADYVTPQFLGGTSGVMLGVRIKEAFVTTGDWPVGAALAICMLVAFVVLYGLVTLALQLTGVRRIRFSS